MNSFIFSMFIIFSFIYSLNCERCDLPKFKYCWKIKESEEFKSYTTLECCRPHFKKSHEQNSNLGKDELCIKRIEYCCHFEKSNRESQRLCESTIKELWTTTEPSLLNYQKNVTQRTTSRRTTRSGRRTTRWKSTTSAYVNIDEENDGKIWWPQDFDKVKERENEEVNATSTNIVTDGSNQNIISANSTSITKDETNMEHETTNNAEYGQISSENEAKVNRTIKINQHNSNLIYFENLNGLEFDSHSTNFDKFTKTSDAPKNNKTIKILQTAESSPTTTDFTRTTFSPKIQPLTTESTAAPQPTTMTSLPMTRSEIKCAEYGMSNIQKIKVSGLIGHKPREVTVDKCRHKAIPLVVGGREAMPYEFPHQALLGYEYEEETIWKCGGSLVSRNFILTAAHCVEDLDLGYVKTVKLGAINQFENTEKVLIRNVVEHWEHPDYDRLNRVDDIALLKLDLFVPLSEYINPICLPIKQAENKHAIGIGFGATDRELRSLRLMKVVLEQFEPYYPTRIPNETIVDKFIYFGHRTQRKDTCNGDSGSPLQISNDMNVKCSYTQIGIVSYGPMECGIPGVPAVYTNVFYYVDWITKYIWEDEDREEELNRTYSNTQ